MPGEQSVRKELSSKRKLLINSKQSEDSDFRQCKLLNVTVKGQEVFVVLILFLR